MSLLLAGWSGVERGEDHVERTPVLKPYRLGPTFNQPPRQSQHGPLEGRICPLWSCGATFTASRRDQKYCAYPCARAASNENRARNRA